MIWVYRLLFLPLFILSIPYILWHMKRRGGYEENQTHRFGDLPDCGKKDPNKKRLWIQAVSVGEVRALRGFLIELANTSQVEVILTTTTSTGYRIARESYRDLVKHVFYFPLDFAPFSLKAWNRIQPDLCILTEGELWPEHIHRARKKNVPIVLINARVSDKTLRIYRRLGILARWIFRNLTLVVASSEGNAERFRELGCSSDKVYSVGNLKCDVPIPELLSTETKNKLARELGIPERAPGRNQSIVLCGASTWPGEESALFRICRRLLAEGIDIRLLITPRHMERREEIRSYLEDFELTYHFRSEGSASELVQVCVADTTGELTKFLQLSDIVFVGRSLPPHQGGQTPIEAGMLKKPILFGPDMSNFREIANSLERHGVAERVSGEQELETIIRKLCQQPGLRHKRGVKAEQWLEENRGATQRTLHILAPFWNT